MKTISIPRELVIVATAIVILAVLSAAMYLIAPFYALYEKRSEAEAITVMANARAQAKREEADAEAYYNEKVSPTVTDRILALKHYEKWNGSIDPHSGQSLTITVPSLK